VRLLADTHVVFWATMERTRLSQAARAALEEDENDVFVSVASAWEIAIKVGVGKWPEARDLLFDFEHHMGDAGFAMLPITVAHVRTAGLMGGIHRDPFDRVLAAQAMIDGLTLVTIDTNLASLGAACIW
jgi:PIN domain nuclease of toxin-antitoxin system